MSVDLADAIRINLLSPAVLFFVLGILATLARSDLRFPEPLYVGLTIYLLTAIGFKGGVSVAKAGLAAVWWPALAAMVLGALVPLWTYPILRIVGRISAVDAAAIAAHYGSVSAVARRQHWHLPAAEARLVAPDLATQSPTIGRWLLRSRCHRGTARVHDRAATG